MNPSLKVPKGALIWDYDNSVLNCDFNSYRHVEPSGGLEVLVGVIEPLTSLIRLPGEVLPLALLRPLSGSGAFGITAELVQTYGADSYIGNLASTMNGSLDNVLCVGCIFGSVGVHRYRHALWAGLAADITGCIASILAHNGS